jgi:hypothetical protein
MCPSYQWKNHGSELLRLLNRGRADTMHWTASLKTLEGVAKDAGLRMIDHCGYLSPLTLQAWDIGLRPLSAVLVKLIGKLTEADRGEIKREWMEIVRPFLVEMCEMDAASTAHGFHVAVFEPH